MIALLFALILQATVPMRAIDKGTISQMDDARRAGVKSVDEWSKLWTLHAGERARPAIDFSKEIVIGVFMGSRPSAGFSVEIVRVREEGASLVVSYRETRPAPDSVAAQVLTSPFHIVAVPKGATTDVKFERVN